MHFRVLKLDSIDGRSKYLNTILKFEVPPFVLLEYLTFIDKDTLDIICFYCYNEKNESSIFMIGHLKPVIINKKETSYFDFQSPYGYSGPVYSHSVDDETIQCFWNKVDTWYKDNNVVTEFIRFDLFENWKHYTGKLFPSILNIKGRIVEYELQWSLFNRKVRKNVTRAKRERLEFIIHYKNISENSIKEFHQVYQATMHRRNAGHQFNFSLNQFKNFITNKSEYCAIGNIYYNNKVISSELVLISNKAIYSFLGGTDEKYFDKRPNDFLKYELINWARSKGKQFYILGGGVNYEDGIYKYKKSFFPNDTILFNTGRKIIDKKIYRELVEAKNIENKINGDPLLNIKDDSFFPIYNKPE